MSFTTIGLPPTVTTTVASSVTANSAVTGGNVISDGGAPVIERGICYNTTGSPTMADNVITSGSGIGSFTVNMTGLTGTTTYYVCAYAINAVDTSYGIVESFTTLFACGAKIKDYDNNEYNTLQLGTQCWMKENLKTTHYADGTSITLGSSSSTSSKYRYYPNNNSSNVATYGYLYNWPAVMNGKTTECVQGVCPNGWHVPSSAEWTQLTNYVSSQSQYLCSNNSSYITMALSSNIGWASSSGTCYHGNNLSNNNLTGFGAMPAGSAGSSYEGFNQFAGFWTSTLNTSTTAYVRYWWYNSESVYSYNNGFYVSRSVRCLKD